MKRTMLCVAMLAVILFEIVGFSISISDRGATIFAYYTQISNLVTLASAIALVASLVKNAYPTWVKALRYVSSCMLLMTALVTVCVLVPMGGSAHVLLFSGNGVFHHTLVPIVSIASYLLLEEHVEAKGIVAVPPVVTCIYGFTMIAMNALRLFDGPYPFFQVYNQSVAATVLWVVALFGIVAGLSLGIYAVSMRIDRARCSGER